MTALLTLVSFAVMGSRRPKAEAFASIWSALMLCALSIGGTMIMRKFHNSLAVGFFMGAAVSSAQLFFLLFLLFIGYAKDQKDAGMSAKEEVFMALCSLIQSALLGSFAVILAAHRSEILETSTKAAAAAAAAGGSNAAVMDMMDELHGISSSAAATTSRREERTTTSGGDGETASYEAPSVPA